MIRVNVVHFYEPGKWRRQEQTRKKLLLKR